MLLVGVPKEIKYNEYRVGIVLSTVPDSDCVAAPPTRWFSLRRIGPLG
jgi:hypothetical protein